VTRHKRQPHTEPKAPTQCTEYINAGLFPPAAARVGPSPGISVLAHHTANSPRNRDHHPCVVCRVSHQRDSSVEWGTSSQTVLLPDGWCFSSEAASQAPDQVTTMRQLREPPAPPAPPARLGAHDQLRPPLGGPKLLIGVPFLVRLMPSASSTLFCHAGRSSNSSSASSLATATLPSSPTGASSSLAISS